VLTRLVRQFYAHVEVVQNEDNGIIFQSTIMGHVIMVDPMVINQIIDVPMLQMAPSLDELREFFHAVPQGEEHASTIRIGALSPPHHMLGEVILF